MEMPKLSDQRTRLACRRTQVQFMAVKEVMWKTSIRWEPEEPLPIRADNIDFRRIRGLSQHKTPFYVLTYCNWMCTAGPSTFHTRLLQCVHSHIWTEDGSAHTRHPTHTWAELLWLWSSAPIKVSKEMDFSQSILKVIITVYVYF